MCGGIAAYKALELCRLLKKQGCDVRVVMTEAAGKFVGALSFQALTGQQVHTQLLSVEEENAMGHINLARWADQIIIAPATANMIAKMAVGLADDLLSTLFLAAECPVTIAPAMNQAMWAKPVVQDNVQRLQQQGVKVIGPATGEQACGETGLGRMEEAQVICSQVLKHAVDSPISNTKFLISAGPTREPLDPVRYITNRSSGKMGYALAEAAQSLGAEVTLVSGPVLLSPPANVRLIEVETAQQMYEQVVPLAACCDVYIGTAAVADYRPKQIQSHKIKKQGDEMTLPLEKNPDIVASVARLSSQRPYVVGFAAETDDLETYALNKMHQKNLDMIAANWVGQADSGFDSDLNALQVYWQGGQQALSKTTKQKLAEQLIHLIIEQLDEKNTAQNT